MSRVIPYWLCCGLLALSACAGPAAGPATTPDEAPEAPTPAVPLPDWLANDEPDRDAQAKQDQHYCPQVFKLTITTETTTGQPWVGQGKMLVDGCMPPWVDFDSKIWVRLPEFNRRLKLTGHLQEDSTDTDKHLIGRKLAGRGDGSNANLSLWTVDARFTQHSVVPYWRTEGTITRQRTRWSLAPDGTLSTKDDSLVATFTGAPVGEAEPKNCPEL